MTPAEIVVLNHLADAWNTFCRLETEHPHDAEEFMRAIHAAQNIVMSRAARRESPEIFTKWKAP